MLRSNVFGYILPRLLAIWPQTDATFLQTMKPNWKVSDRLPQWATSIMLKDILIYWITQLRDVWWKVNKQHNDVNSSQTKVIGLQQYLLFVSKCVCVCMCVLFWELRTWLLPSFLFLSFSSSWNQHGPLRNLHNNDGCFMGHSCSWMCCLPQWSHKNKSNSFSKISNSFSNPPTAEPSKSETIFDNLLGLLPPPTLPLSLDRKSVV